VFRGVPVFRCSGVPGFSTAVSGRDAELIFIAIYLTIFRPLILVRKVHILAKNSVPRVKNTIFPRVKSSVPQTQRFLPDPTPRPRVFHLAAISTISSPEFSGSSVSGGSPGRTLGR